MEISDFHRDAGLKDYLEVDVRKDRKKEVEKKVCRQKVEAKQMDFHEWRSAILWGKIEGFRAAMVVLDYEDDDWPHYSILEYNRIVGEYEEAKAMCDSDEDLPSC